MEKGSASSIDDLRKYMKMQPIPGCSTDNWLMEALLLQELDLEAFNRGSYEQVVESWWEHAARRCQILCSVRASLAIQLKE